MYISLHINIIKWIQQAISIWSLDDDTQLPISRALVGSRGSQSQSRARERRWSVDSGIRFVPASRTQQHRASVASMLHSDIAATSTLPPAQSCTHALSLSLSLTHFHQAVAWYSADTDAGPPPRADTSVPLRDQEYAAYLLLLHGIFQRTALERDCESRPVHAASLAQLTRTAAILQLPCLAHSQRHHHSRLQPVQQRQQA